MESILCARLLRSAIFCGARDIASCYASVARVGYTQGFGGRRCYRRNVEWYFRTRLYRVLSLLCQIAAEGSSAAAFCKCHATEPMTGAYSVPDCNHSELRIPGRSARATAPCEAIPSLASPKNFLIAHVFVDKVPSVILHSNMGQIFQPPARVARVSKRWRGR